VVDPRSKTAQQHPDWLVKDKKGKPLVSGYFYDFYGHALDLTQPVVLDHIRSLLETIARKWGYGFVKTDFVYSGALPGVRQNPTMTRAQAFRKGMETVREGIGDSTFLLGCGCPFGPAVGLVDAMRIGPDTAPSWTPFLWSVKWATPIIKSEKSIAALRNNIRHTLNLSTLHQRWWWNDPDCLMVRNYDTTLGDDEVISNLSLVGLSGGLLISSDDLTRLPVERQKLVALLTPLMGVSGRPLDLLERELAELYSLPFYKNGMGWHDVAVFNWSDKPAERSLDLARLGYEAGHRVHVFDFWQKKHSLQQAGRIELGTIASHGCRMLRICRSGEVPAVVGDTLHITQGCEIESWRVAGKSLEIGTVDLGRRVQGSLWLALPGGPVSASCGGNALKFEKENDDIYRLDLDFQGRAGIKIQWE
jgi:alpha-galactosidase